MVRSKFLAAALGLAVAAVAPAQADVVTFSASTWLAAVTSPTYSSSFGALYSSTSTPTLSNGTALSADDTLTVLQSTNGWGVVAAGAYGPSSGGQYSGDLLDTSGANANGTTTELTLSFSGLTALGLYLQPDDALQGSTSNTITALLSDGTTASKTVSFSPSSGTSQFVGFYFAPGVTSLQLTVTNVPAANGDFVVGNVASAVPEMATWAMMLTGFAGVALRLRRQSVAAA